MNKNKIILLLIILSLSLQISLLQAIISTKFCSNIYPENSKNVILVFNDMHESYNTSTGECQLFTNSILTDMMQLQQFIDDLNANNANLSIGIRICDTCQDTYLAQILFNENLIYLKQTMNLTIIGKCELIIDIISMYKPIETPFQ